MDNDIRRPQHQLPRRDYSLPANSPPQPIVPPGPAPAPQTATPEPLLYEQPPLSQSRQDYDYRHDSPEPVTQAKVPGSRIAHFASPKTLGLIIAASILLIAAGLYLSKPVKKAGATAVQLAKKSSFSFYYPQPLPAGYSYVSDLNAFQNGQAYFMLASGKKHIVVHEQTAGSAGNQVVPAPSSEDFNSSVGKVALGTTAGELSAQITTGSTYILINTTGSVPKTDLVNTINSLKVIK